MDLSYEQELERYVEKLESVIDRLSEVITFASDKLGHHISPDYAMRFLTPACIVGFLENSPDFDKKFVQNSLAKTKTVIFKKKNSPLELPFTYYDKNDKISYRKDFLGWQCAEAIKYIWDIAIASDQNKLELLVELAKSDIYCSVKDLK